MQITCVHNTENAGFCDLIHTLCTAQAVLSRKLCYNSTVLLRKTWIPITVLSNYHTFVVSKTSLFRRRLQQNRHFVFVLSWLCFFGPFKKTTFQECTENLYGILLHRNNILELLTLLQGEMPASKNTSYFIVISILSGGGVLKRDILSFCCYCSLFKKFTDLHKGKQKYFQATTPLGRSIEYSRAIQAFQGTEDSLHLSGILSEQRST